MAKYRGPVGLADASGGIQVKGIWRSPKTQNYASNIQVDWAKVLTRMKSSDAASTALQNAAFTAAAATDAKSLKRIQDAKTTSVVPSGTVTSGSSAASSDALASGAPLAKPGPVNRMTAGPNGTGFRNGPGHSAATSMILTQLNPGIQAKLGLLPDRQHALKGKQYFDLSYENMKLVDEIGKAQGDLKIMGHTPKPEHHNSILNRVMDVLSRGEYASADAVKAWGKNRKDNPHAGFFDMSVFGDAGKGAWAGLTGKDKTTYSEMLHNTGMAHAITAAIEPIANSMYGAINGPRPVGAGPHKVASAIGAGVTATVGLGLDIGLDPTSYTGVGAVPKVLKVGTKVGKLGKLGDVSTHTIDTVKAYKRIDELTTSLLNLDLDKVGYHLPDGSKLSSVKDIRRQQVRELFSGKAGHAGTPAGKEQIAHQLKAAEDYLDHASKAAVAENSAAAAAAIEHLNSYSFIDKTAKQVYKDFEVTAAADIMDNLAKSGRKLVDIPVSPTVKTAKFNPAKWKTHKVAINKQVTALRSAQTKLRNSVGIDNFGSPKKGSVPMTHNKAGETVAQVREKLTVLKNKERDLLHEIDHVEQYRMPVGDAAPDPRAFDVKYDHSAIHAATKNNRDIMNEVSRQLKEVAPKGIEETHAQLLEMALKNVDPEVTRLIQVRFGGMFGNGGAVLATFRAPDVFRKSAEKFATVGYDPQALNVWNKATIGFSKAFRASGSLNKFIDAERLRTAGRAQELIRVHVQDIRATYGKIKIENRREMFKAFLHQTPLDAMGPELSPILKEFENELTDIGKLFDGSLNESSYALGPIPLGDFTRWLPKRRVSISKVLDPSLPVGGVDWWASALRESRTNDIGEVLHHLRIAKEKTISRRMLTQNIEDTLGISKNTNSGMSSLFDYTKTKHGYETAKGFSEDVVFSPEIHRDLHRLLELIDHQDSNADVLRAIDKVTNIWKGAVTVYSPAFHLRNSAGDIFVSWLNGMFQGVDGIPRAMKSHRAAAATLKQVSWNKLPAAKRISMINGENIDTVGKIVLQLKGRGFKDIGNSLTAEQIWGAYLKYGLKQGFTTTEFGNVIGTTRGARGALSKVNDGIRGASETREDWFRLAHFIDVLQRESKVTRSFDRAAEKAAADVRKFHFDYSDFTPFERSTMVRAIPFYKWTRKSLPLMAEMLFAHPGQMTVYNKGLSAASQMMGYPVVDSPLIPNSDSIIPDWIKSRGAVPMYTSKKGNTVFYDPSNPFNDTVRTWQGNSPKEFLTGKAEVMAVAAMANPALRVPYELASGTQVFGQTPIKDKRAYMLNQTPESSFLTKFLGGQNKDLPLNDRIGSPESLNKILAGGTIENTDKAQKGELQKFNDLLNQQRKAARKKEGLANPR